MKKPSEIFEEHIDSLIHYLNELHDQSKEITNQMEICEDANKFENLRISREIYNEVFNELSTIVKRTMESAFQAKIYGNNIGDNLIEDEQ